MFSVGSGNTKRCHILLHSYHGLWTGFGLVFRVVWFFFSKSHLSLVLERCLNLVAIFTSFVLGCGLGWFCVVFGYVLLIFSCGLVKSTKEVVSGRAEHVLSHFLFCFFPFFFWVKFDIDCGFGQVFGCEVTRVFVWFRLILSRLCVALGVEGVSGRLFLISIV